MFDLGLYPLGDARVMDEDVVKLIAPVSDTLAYGSGCAYSDIVIPVLTEDGERSAIYLPTVMN